MSVTTDESTEQRFYEPWQPQIGQRVRVRLSGECQWKYPEIGLTGGFGHAPEMDGRTGVIRKHPCPDMERVAHDAQVDGHGYNVQFDGELITYELAIEHVWLSQCFAAIELEPVSDD